MWWKLQTEGARQLRKNTRPDHRANSSPSYTVILGCFRMYKSWVLGKKATRPGRYLPPYGTVARRSEACRSVQSSDLEHRAAMPRPDEAARAVVLDFFR